MGGGQGKVADGHAHIEACDHSPIFACFDKLEDAAEAASCKEEVAGFFTRKTGKKELLARPVIKTVGENEMMGMMELVREETYANELKGKGSKASAMFCDNLDSITRASVVAWLHKVKLFKQLGPSNLEMLSEVAHFRSLAVGNEVLKQGETVTRLQVVLSGSLDVIRIREGDVVFEKDSHGIDFYVLVQGAVSIDDGEDVHVTLDHKGGNTTIACIPGETFRTLCLTSPSVAAEFEIKALGAKASIGALLTRSDRAAAEKTLDDEFASENYRFWLDAEDYKSNHAMGGDPKDLWAQVDKIYATYVTTTTTDEQINLSGKATKILKKYFDERRPSRAAATRRRPATSSTAPRSASTTT
ncbi:cAMP-dependent protein kinase regulator [Aureococcus anophagefferens]|uniref:cAMP-dependent protein kinase regulator n=1 Tax=Aureococcus anophagefferens TaxID=44056 RepID=A0ABR1G2J0_AURAN